MIEKKSLFTGEEGADFDLEKSQATSSRIPKRIFKKNLSPSSHGINVAELSMQATELAGDYDQPSENDRRGTQDVNYNRSKLDESFEEDEDRIKIRQIQSRYKMYSRPQYPGSSRNLDNDPPRSFFPSSRLSPTYANPLDSPDLTNENAASSSNNQNSDHAFDQGSSTADQSMKHLKSEQKRISFLEQKIKELQEENAYLLEKLTSTSNGRHSVDHAKIEVLEKRVLELENECKMQAQFIKERNILNAKLENRVMQLEEEILSCRDELLLIRSQLQTKAAKVSSLEQELSMVKRREAELSDELNDARVLLEEYEHDRLTINQSSLSANQVPVATAGDDEKQDEDNDDVQIKISLLTIQIEDLTRDRDEFILKSSSLEESLRVSQLEKEKLSQDLIALQKRYDDFEVEMIDKLLEAELKNYSIAASLPSPDPPVAIDLTPVTAHVPVMDQETMTVVVATEAEERAAADKAQADIEIQRLLERLKQTERALLVFKYFYKLRDKMLEGKILELQALADIFEKERKPEPRKPKEIIKEVFIPSPTAVRSRIWSLVQVWIVY